MLLLLLMLLLSSPKQRKKERKHVIISLFSDTNKIFEECDLNRHFSKKKLGAMKEKLFFLNLPMIDCHCLIHHYQIKHESCVLSVNSAREAFY